LTENARKLHQICNNDLSIPVLFISSPQGDRFEFGTREELENEAEALQTEGEVTIELTSTHDIRDRLDFETYEDDQPTLVL
jgi:predicted alpha/beta-hydrolase family hydrolase